MAKKYNLRPLYGDEAYNSITRSGRYEKAKGIRHHYKTSVARHSMRTAEYGRNICHFLKRRGIEVSEEAVVQACLLHDIGMTDDDVADCPSFMKAYRHPRRGENIARKEYLVNEITCNSIRRHMWPICIIPPKFLEGWVVVAADKCCSIWEITRKK